jgi:hypothetical protein
MAKFDEDFLDAAKDVSFVIGELADCIKPRELLPMKDDSGGLVGSLTEAVMGVTGGLVKIADAINNLAEAVREHKKD